MLVPHSNNNNNQESLFIKPCPVVETIHGYSSHAERERLKTKEPSLHCTKVASNFLCSSTIRNIWKSFDARPAFYRSSSFFRRRFTPTRRRVFAVRPWPRDCVQNKWIKKKKGQKRTRKSLETRRLPTLRGGKTRSIARCSIDERECKSSREPIAQAEKKTKSHSQSQRLATAL